MPVPAGLTARTLRAPALDRLPEVTARLATYAQDRRARPRRRGAGPRPRPRRLVHADHPADLPGRRPRGARLARRLPPGSGADRARGATGHAAPVPGRGGGDRRRAHRGRRPHHGPGRRFDDAEPGIGPRATGAKLVATRPRSARSNGRSRWWGQRAHPDQPARTPSARRPLRARAHPARRRDRRGIGRDRAGRNLTWSSSSA